MTSGYTIKNLEMEVLCIMLDIVGHVRSYGAKYTKIFFDQNRSTTNTARRKETWTNIFVDVAHKAPLVELKELFLSN